MPARTRDSCAWSRPEGASSRRSASASSTAETGGTERSVKEGSLVGSEQPTILLWGRRAFRSSGTGGVRCRALPQISRGDPWIRRQVGARSFERQFPGFQDVAIVGNLQRGPCVLFDEEDRYPCALQCRTAA